MKIDKKKRETNFGTLFKTLNAAWGLGFVIALPPVIFVLIGIFLDNFFQTSPLLTVFLLLFGVIAGAYSGYKEIKDLL